MARFRLGEKLLLGMLVIFLLMLILHITPRNPTLPSIQDLFPDSVARHSDLDLPAESKQEAANTHEAVTDSLTLDLNPDEVTEVISQQTDSPDDPSIPFYPPMSDRALFELQTDESVARTIYSAYLQPPIVAPYNYSLADVEEELLESRELQEVVLRFLGNKTQGFFVESGAGNGVTNSHTFYLESEMFWTGILLEPNPDLYQMLNDSHRKAWSLEVCFGDESRKIQITKKKLVEYEEESSTTVEEMLSQTEETIVEEVEVQCFQLASLLAAVGHGYDVDYLSLDSPSSTLKNLASIPWKYVNVNVISLEQNEDITAGTNFLKSRGFRHVVMVKGPSSWDHVFLHSRLVDAYISTEESEQ